MVKSIAVQFLVGDSVLILGSFFKVAGITGDRLVLEGRGLVDAIECIRV